MMRFMPAYGDVGERLAWLNGYCDGLNGVPQRVGVEYVNAYSKGYWEGRHERTLLEQSK